MNVIMTRAASREASRAARPDLTSKHRLCVIHPIDPRGQKVGGIETHVRLVLKNAPKDWSVLLVGVDGFGDCQIGEVTRMEIEGRELDFLPVVHFPETNIHEAAKSLLDSITFRFLAGMIRQLPALARAIGRKPATIELQRFEFALIPLLLRCPAIQVIHGEGSRKDKMDSLIKKYWFVHRLNELLAIRLAHEIVCVNPNILARLLQKSGAIAKRAAFMPVPVDTQVFQRRDFDVTDGVLRVVFAGRLDEFKDPPVMFKVLSRVHELLGGACEFHYVGTSDPWRYREYALIDSFTIRHGFASPAKVAEIMARCHMGILTSHFEGMPCYLLEVLATGRPVAAIRLPQYDLVIEEGVSGTMIGRMADESTMVEALARKIVSMWSDIRQERLSTAAIHAKAAQFSVDRQFAYHYAKHKALVR